VSAEPFTTSVSRDTWERACNALAPLPLPQRLHILAGHGIRPSRNYLYLKTETVVGSNGWFQEQYQLQPRFQ